MRTTLTLDDDVAARLDQLRAERQSTLKRVVNDALRAGLEALSSERKPASFRTKTAELGRCLIGDIDDIQAALSLAEGDQRS